MREIPGGTSDFKEIRDNNLCYVDKTPIIDYILKHPGEKVFLFTRPRRFGKSLNLSMIDAYFNREYAGNTWFDNLRISEMQPEGRMKNDNTVIYLDLKDLGNGTS